MSVAELEVYADATKRAPARFMENLRAGRKQTIATAKQL
jgi:hypothetical protein